MSIEPFLANLPPQLRENLEVEDFFSTMIFYLNQVKNQVNTTETNTENNENVNDPFNDPYAGVPVINQPREDEDVPQRLNYPGVRTITIDGNIVEVLNGQIANASNGGVAVLATNPEEGYQVKIRNNDGSLIRINGNGRLINGNSVTSVTTKYQVRTVQYFIDTDDYGIV